MWSEGYPLSSTKKFRKSTRRASSVGVRPSFPSALARNGPRTGHTRTTSSTGLVICRCASGSGRWGPLKLLSPFRLILPFLGNPFALAEALQPLKHHLVVGRAPVPSLPFLHGVVRDAHRAGYRRLGPSLRFQPRNHHLDGVHAAKVSIQCLSRQRLMPVPNRTCNHRHCMLYFTHISTRETTYE